MPPQLLGHVHEAAEQPGASLPSSPEMTGIPHGKRDPVDKVGDGKQAEESEDAPAHRAGLDGRYHEGRPVLRLDLAREPSSPSVAPLLRCSRRPHAHTANAHMTLRMPRPFQRREELMSSMPIRLRSIPTAAPRLLCFR